MTTEQITVPKQTWDDMKDVLQRVLHTVRTWDNSDDFMWIQYRLPEVLTAAYAVSEQSKPVSLQWLAEMIMSDCGCSTNNERLLERIISRIEQYDRANTLQTDDIEDHVTVPRGLLGAACAAIGRKADAPKTLQMLRVYTMQSAPCQSNT